MNDSILDALHFQPAEMLHGLLEVLECTMKTVKETEYPAHLPALNICVLQAGRSMQAHSWTANWVAWQCVPFIKPLPIQF